jgi:hypothetical protein
MIGRIQDHAWDGAYLLRGLFDVLRWPFERAAWAIERAIVWPLEERTGDWSGALRGLAPLALVLIAVGAGVLGLVWASGGGGKATRTQATAPGPAPVVAEQPAQAPPATAPVLHGVKPNFKLEGAGGASETGGKGSGTASGETEATAGSAESTAAASASTVLSSGAKKAGPKAIAVAHRFSDAFVLYEIGRTDAGVRTAFGETAAPRLARTLLRRPPRLPAGTEVPQAKVLNIVAGPRHGDTYTLSASLLRLGVTSELRLDMQRNARTDEWQVTDVRG